MSRIATLIVLAAVLTIGSAAGAPAASEQTTPTLRVTHTYPLTLRGAAFKAREQVTLTVKVETMNARRVRKLTTGRLGGFTTSFPTLLGIDRCDVTATAVGNRGSRATLKTPQLQCRPRPIIHVTDTRPVTVVGAQFLDGERVVVRAVLDGNAFERRARSTSAGRFTLTFTGLNVVDRCNSDLFVRAIGAGGSEATAKIGPQPQCPPRLSTP